MEQIKYDVFISYSRKDYFDEQNHVIPGNEVSKIMQALTEAGISYWIDKERIDFSQNYVEKITQSIRASRILLFLSTYNSNYNSDYTALELASASEWKKCILPVRIDPSLYSDTIMFRIATLESIPYHENPDLKRVDMVYQIKERLAIIKKKEEENRKREDEEKNNKIKELQSSINLIESSINNLNNEKSTIINQIEQIDLMIKQNNEKLSQHKTEQDNLNKLQRLSLKPVKKELIKYDVYISYSQQDYLDDQYNIIPSNEVSKIIHALEEAGISFEKNIIEKNDESFSQKAIQVIRASRIFIFLSTHNSNFNSEKTTNEVAVAYELKKCILPLRVDSSEYSDKIMFRISNLTFIDYYVNPEQGRADMINTIKKQLEIIKKNEEVQRKQEEKDRQESYLNRQQEIEGIQSTIKQIYDDNEQLKGKKSDGKDAIKKIENEIKNSTQQHTELTRQLNELTNGPTPPPIPFIDINNYLNRWNWGGIFFGCIWGLKNRLYHISLAIITLEIILIASSLSDIRFKLWFFAIIPFIGIRILFGSKGNQLAWKERKPEMSFDDFRSLQQKWCLAGIILLTSIIIIVIIAASTSS